MSLKCTLFSLLLKIDLKLIHNFHYLFLLSQVTNIHQRHLAPQIQPRYTSNLEPRPKSLVVKRSMRCRVCEHNLCKADFSPSSIKFRINLNALYHVPELRFIIIPPTINKGSTFDLKQTMSKTNLTLGRRTSSTLVSMKYEPVIHSNATPGQVSAYNCYNLRC